MILRNLCRSSVSQQASILNSLGGRIRHIVNEFHAVVLFGIIDILYIVCRMNWSRNMAMVMRNARTRIANTSQPGCQVLTYRRTSHFVDVNTNRFGIITGNSHIAEFLSSEASIKINKVCTNVLNSGNCPITCLQITLEALIQITEE